MTTPPINSQQLKKDARLASAGSRRSTRGTTALLREHLEAIDALRAEGVTFAAIAKGLGKQGLTQGKDGNEKPITPSRLTALYSQMKRTDAKRAVARQGRTDAVEPPVKDERPAKKIRKVTLNPELNRQRSSDKDDEQLPDEETIRRERRERAQRFVKPSE